MATTSKKIHPSHTPESTIGQDEFNHLVQFYESDAFLMIYFRIDVLIRKQDQEYNAYIFFYEYS